MPRIGARLLGPAGAQVATNAKVLSGELRSWKRGAQVAAPSVAGTLKSLYRMYSGGIDYWLSWADIVDAVKGPIAGDTLFKLYYTCYQGSAFGPRKTNLALATTVGTDYPHDYLELGLPAPAAAGSLAVVGGAAANVTRTYVYTYVSTTGVWDEEGPPSAGVTVTGHPDGSWNLTGLSTGPVGKYAIDRIRIYRTLTGSTGITNYQLVAEQAVATGSYSDTVADANLGVICPSFTNGVAGSAWVAPPSDMHSLTQMPNGMMVAASKNLLCFSEPYRPWAWPTRYQLALNFDIVGLGVFGNSVVACTKGKPYVYSGSHPSTMSGGAIERAEPCLSKRSIVSFNLYGVAYASPNGLMVVGSGGVANATEDFMSRDDWQALQPWTMVAQPYNDRYFAFYDVTSGQGAGFIIDRSSNTAPFVDVSSYGTGLHVDVETSLLYYIASNVVYQWDADSNNRMPFDWKSKTFILAKPANLGAFQVDADFSQMADATAQAAQAAADAAYNAAILALAETWPYTGKTQGEVDGAMWNTFTWDGSLLREPLATYDARFVTFRVIAFNPATNLMTVKFEKTVTSRAPFSGPDGFKTDAYEFEVLGNIDVRAVKAAETHVGLAQV
mgnify:FL=1